MRRHDNQKVRYPVSTRILTRGDVVTAFVYRRGKSRAECSCGYTGPRRIRRVRAQLDALIHAARTGCAPDQPLTCRVSEPTKSLFERLTPPVVIAMSPLLIIPFGLWAAPDADAVWQSQRITVAVAWTGQPECVRAWVPQGVGTVSVALCSPNKMWTTTYPAPSATRWIGVDPEMSGADSMSCAVAVSNSVGMSDAAINGDGTDVSCLQLWRVL